MKVCRPGHLIFRWWHHYDRVCVPLSGNKFHTAEVFIFIFTASRSELLNNLNCIDLSRLMRGRLDNVTPTWKHAAKVTKWYRTLRTDCPSRINHHWSFRWGFRAPFLEPLTLIIASDQTTIIIVIWITELKLQYGLHTIRTATNIYIQQLLRNKFSYAN